MTSARDTPNDQKTETLAITAEVEVEIDLLRTEANKQRTLIAEQQITIAALQARVVELERRLGLNSGNSGKPPSSDGLRKPPRTVSLREASGRKSGGQKGHPGETLRQVVEPDQVIDHYPTLCGKCTTSLKPEMATGYVVRQVFDLPEPLPLVVTEHRAHSCACTRCGEQTRAEFPNEVSAPVQYGSRIAALVVYLLHYQFIPEDRLVELMSDLFGVKLAAATLARMSANCADHFQGFVTTVCGFIKTAAVKCLDETGFRIGGKTQWLHVAATEWLTFYRVDPKRGSLLEGLIGIVVHDHWKPYYTLKGVLHALCNAHHLRELRALIEMDSEPWAQRMWQLLRRASHATNLARKRGEPLRQSLVDRFTRHYDAIVAEGMAFHETQSPLPSRGKRGRAPRRPGHNLLLRLLTRKEDVLRFLLDSRVPFSNNLAEQAARMMKLKQKISGGFRSEQGSRDFAVIRSLISTARKQGWNVIDTLTQPSEILLAKLRSA